MRHYLDRPLRFVILVILWSLIAEAATATGLAFELYFGRIAGNLAGAAVIVIGLALQELYRKWVLRLEYKPKP